MRHETAKLVIVAASPTPNRIDQQRMRALLHESEAVTTEARQAVRRLRLATDIYRERLRGNANVDRSVD